MKLWTITGPHFEAELSIDGTGTIAAAAAPLEHTIGLVWTDARQLFIDLGWHGSPVEYIRGRSALRRRGWKSKQIEQLGEPDDWADNPHHPTGAMMALFQTDRVVALEEQLGIQRQVSA